MTGLQPAPLFALRMALTLPLAWASLRYVETPIREGRLPVRIGAVGWANASVAATALVIVAITTANLPTVTLATGAQEGELPPPPEDVALPAAADPTTTTTQPSTTTTSTTEAPPTSTPAVDQTAVVAATTPPSTAPPPTSPPSTAPVVTTTTAPPGPVRVMIVGDSIARNLATGLGAWADEGGIVVYDASIQGCTYSRGGVRYPDVAPWPVPDECGWWATDTFRQRVAEFQPDVIVSHMGHNEMYDRDHPNWSGRKSPGDAAFDSFIAGEWIAAATAFTGTDASVLWLNAPCVDTARYPGRMENALAASRVAHMNSVYVPQVANRTDVEVLDFNRHLCANGFTDLVDGVSRARPDGFHLSDQAATAVARSWLGPAIHASAGR